MAVNGFARSLCAASIWLVLSGSPPQVFAQSSMTEMTPAQFIKPDDLDAKELGYYKTLADADKVKSFIETRSYVRLARRVVDRTMPAIQLPNKPPHFNVAYLLPSDVDVINKAIGLSLGALMKQEKR